MAVQLPRRDVLTSLTAGATATAALSLQAKPTLASGKTADRVPFDPTDPRANSMAFLKLVGSQDDEIVRRWFTGKTYAYFPGEPVRELFYHDGFYLGKFWKQDDGTHRSTIYEITFKRDIETGKLLETWDNPFTGRTDELMNSVGGPQERIYNDWGWDRPEKARGPENPRMLEWNFINDTAWFTWDIFFRFRNPIQPDVYPEESSGEYLNLVNLTNYYGSLSDIENPNILNAPATLFYNSVTGWQPWMRMGQRPGTLIGKSVGVKLNSFEELPREVFEAGEQKFPGCLTEKVQWPEGQYMWADFVGGDFYQD